MFNGDGACDANRDDEVFSWKHLMKVMRIARSVMSKFKGGENGDVYEDDRHVIIWMMAVMADDY